MRKKKWVKPFLDSEEKYLLKDYSSVDYSKPVYVEIGMGMGDFICQSAKNNPDILYIGLEKEEICVARAIKKAQDLNLDNLKILFIDALEIENLFKENSIDLIYLHFSDPWPKKRNHKRRLTYPSFLKMYEKVLKDKGIIIYKTDNLDFFEDSLLYFEQSNFKLVDMDRDYYVEGEPMTGYQEKFHNEGKPIYYAKYEIDKV